MTTYTTLRRNAFAFSQRAIEIRAPSHLLPGGEDQLDHDSTVIRGRSPVTPTAISPPLRLTVFGGPSLSYFSKSLPLSPYQGALLGLLASHGQRGIRRGELLSLLWNDGDDELLRPRLNQLIYSIHRRLHSERMIRLVGDIYLFEEGCVSSDLELFLSYLRDRQLGEAIGILGRGFMSGLESSPSAAFERWGHARELRYRSDLRSLAFERWREGEQRADWSMAEEAAEILLRLDPDDEGALRKLIQSRALRGRVREAESTYAEFVELARIEDPEYTPEDETERLFARLGELGRQEMTIRPALSAHSTYEALPFVGRIEELSTLAQIIRNTGEGGAKIFFVTGEGGIGKTRLIREALARAPFDGVRVLSGRCSEFEKGIPLNPILSALSEDRASAALSELGDPWQTILLRHLPEHRDSRSVDEVSYRTPIEEVPRVTCEAFLRLFQVLARTDPVVLFLDDVQWIDPTSLSVLAYVRERWEGGGLLILGAFRGGDVVPDSELSRWIAGETSLRPDSSLSLGPLSRPHLSSLLAHSLASTEDQKGERAEILPDSIADVIDFAEGHPLLALECLQTVIAEGAKSSVSPRRVSVPEELKKMVSRRVSQLSDQGTRLVSLLSACDRPVGISILQDACQLTSGGLAQVLDEVSSRHLVTVSTRGAAFQHGLLRNAVYQDLTPGMRIDAHRRIADVLESQGDSPPIQDIALHLLMAGEPARAMPFVFSAARSLTDSGGWEESKQLLELALDSDPAPNQRAEIAALLGRVSLLLGEFAEAEVRWTEARETYRSLGKEEDSLSAHLRLLEIERLSPDCDHERLVKNVRALRDEAADRNLGKLVAECLDLEVRILDGLRRFDEVRELMAGVLHLVDPSDVDAHVQLLFVSAVEAVYGDPEGAAKLADQAAEVATIHNRPDLLLKALNWKIIAFYHQARLCTPEGISLISEATKSALNSSDFEQRFWLECNLGAWHVEVGDHGAAERAFDRAESALIRLPHPSHRRNLHLNRGQLALEMGDYQLAFDSFTAATRLRSSNSVEPSSCFALAGLGLVHLHRGEISRAKEIYELLPPRPVRWTFDPYVWLLFEVRIATLSQPRDRVTTLMLDLEKGLKESVPTAWIRIRLLRFEIALRSGTHLVAEEIEDLSNYLDNRALKTRRRELDRVLERFHQRRGSRHGR